MLHKKKGAIGTTLTWFPGFVVVFFMMVIFFVGVGLLLGSRNLPEISSSMSGSKSLSLGDSLSEPFGYDPGDLELQRALAVFLERGSEVDGRMVSTKDMIAGFDSGNMQASANYNVFYKEATGFFDNYRSIYGIGCYVLCLDFREKSGNSYEPRGNNVAAIGRTCLYGGEDINNRMNSYYEPCYVSEDSISTDVFNYAYLEIYPDNNRMVRVKILNGGINPTRLYEGKA